MPSGPPSAAPPQHRHPCHHHILQSGCGGGGSRRCLLPARQSWRRCWAGRRRCWRRPASGGCRADCRCRAGCRCRAAFVAVLLAPLVPLAVLRRHWEHPFSSCVGAPQRKGCWPRLDSAPPLHDASPQCRGEQRRRQQQQPRAEEEADGARQARRRARPSRSSNGKRAHAMCGPFPTMLGVRSASSGCVCHTSKHRSTTGLPACHTGPCPRLATSQMTIHHALDPAFPCRALLLRSQASTAEVRALHGLCKELEGRQRQAAAPAAAAPAAQRQRHEQP